ncbi:hypothetical protein H6762_01475 [Candidatus Nomurabacteria bacterium]|nr:hypothetical protein [Candidatus Nomurabacteria bacterium]
MLRSHFNKNSKRFGLLLVALLLISSLLGALRASPIQAHTLSPFYKDYLLYTGEVFDDSFKFTNTSDEDLTFDLLSSPYNPESEEFSTELDRNFVTPKFESIKVLANTTVEVPYSVSIPEKTTSGSYFSVVYLEEDKGRVERETTTQIRAGFGMIVALHVVEEGASVKGAFTQLSDILVNVLDRGFPYLHPIQLTYRYENLSDYVFTPEGELRIFDTVTNERLAKERLNADGARAYPDRTFSEDFTFDLWTIDNAFHDLRVVTRTYNQFDDAYLESAVIIPGLNRWGVYGGVAVLLFIIYLTINKFKQSLSSTR